jgi:ubiquinol-cytochrome c reductase cytochrome c1 subunit
MKTTILLLALVLSPVAAFAAGGHGAKLDPVKIDLNDQASLQRGARIFINYCLSCHSAAYMRYNRLGNDLGLSEELVKDNLLFAADKVGELMKAVMPAADAKAVFGVVPPDLTVITRARGEDWFYTYMRGFYRDPKSATGWNNSVFPHVAMPHVLYEWQGQQRAVLDKDGKFEKFEIERPGTMGVKEYDAAMRDLTNFMVYMGEPAKLVRYRLGWYVLAFLLVFTVFAYLLKKEYWKDVH